MAVYDDFAHHPTAIATTLAGMRAKVGQQRILAVLEPRSNTMKLGVLADQLAPALATADLVFMLQPEGLQWSVAELVPQAQVADSIEHLVDQIVAATAAGDHIVVMSNGGFGQIHQRLLQALA